MYDMPISSKDFVLQFASFLLKSNSLRFGVFTLASGKQSAYYIDLRVLPSFPGYFRLGISGVEDVVALVDRHEGAEDKLKKMGIKLSAVTGISDIVNSLYNVGLIDETALESVLKQMVTHGEYEID